MGDSTGLAPIHVRISTTDTNLQNLIFLVGTNLVDFDFFMISRNMIKIDKTSATTPPSFDGIDRKIA